MAELVESTKHLEFCTKCNKKILYDWKELQTLIISSPIHKTPVKHRVIMCPTCLQYYEV